MPTKWLDCGKTFGYGYWSNILKKGWVWSLAKYCQLYLQLLPASTAPSTTGWTKQPSLLCWKVDRGTVDQPWGGPHHRPGHWEVNHPISIGKSSFSGAKGASLGATWADWGELCHPLSSWKAARLRLNISTKKKRSSEYCWLVIPSISSNLHLHHKSSAASFGVVTWRFLERTSSALGTTSTNHLPWWCQAFCHGDHARFSCGPLDGDSLETCNKLKQAV